MEVLTTPVFLMINQFSLYVWLSNRINDPGMQKKSHFESKKLTLMEWIEYLVLTADLDQDGLHKASTILMLSRDSITDATNGVGLLMTGLYREQ